MSRRLGEKHLQKLLLLVKDCGIKSTKEPSNRNANMNKPVKKRTTDLSRFPAKETQTARKYVKMYLLSYTIRVLGTKEKRGGGHNEMLLNYYTGPNP